MLDCANRIRTVRIIGLASAACLVAALSLTAVGQEDQATTLPADSTRRAAIVTIKGEINDVTLVSMRRRIEDARQAGAGMIIFEMNTPGGLVSSALEICKYLKNLTDLKTVAWVNQDAYSAGAMISLACNEVVMASSSSIGDCAPIIISMEGLKELGKTERAKAESPILKEFRDSALRNGYDPLLCESMVRLGQEVWWMEDGPGGARKFVLQRDKEALLEEEGSAWRPVQKMNEATTGKAIDVRQPVVKERDLLTLSQSEAVAYGFAKAIISNRAELRAHYNITGDLTRSVPNWSEALADFLSSPLVRTVLMMLIALGAYAEFQAPGQFVGAGVALVALIIFLGAPYLTGLADAWEILLVLLGVILMAVEVFIIPGFGVAGILGILLVLVGLIATFVPAEPGPIIVPRMPTTWLGLKTGLRVIFGGLALSLGCVWLLNKYLPQIPGGRRLFLPPARAAIAPAGGAGGSAEAAGSYSVVQLGDAGTTLTKLRPAGKAQINARRVDVIAQGQMIGKGRAVEVVELAGGRVVVREMRKT
jgi:membrane-bound serine protease (ClpP class)